jgi:hypothetical protein
MDDHAVKHRINLTWTGRKVHERKLSSLMKKMKESCKLDINQSVQENILSRLEVKRKQCGGDL